MYEFCLFQPYEFLSAGVLGEYLDIEQHNVNIGIFDALALFLITHIDLSGRSDYLTYCVVPILPLDRNDTNISNHAPMRVI
jgi:hypothetical protein